MISRAKNPDTSTDIEIRSCIDSGKSFIMTSGAGSGKTTSLIKSLEYISEKHGNRLKKNKQYVACITYTNVAEREIIADTKNNPLFQVSTIHGFLWQLIKPFKEDIRDWLYFRVAEKLSELNEKRAAFSSRVQQKTRDKNLADIMYFEDIKSKINLIPSFSYEISSRYLEGVLGHDDILKLGPWLINYRPLLRQIIAYKYPFFFVDESQDTFPSIVESLGLVKSTEPIVVGFFGDPIQQIYNTGIGKIVFDESWLEISKKENFRCSQAVLNVINCIRKDADGLEQEFKSGNSAGKAFFFISAPSQRSRTDTLEAIKSLLAEKTGDILWKDESDADAIKILVIVHRMAAQRLGFLELFSAFSDSTPESLKTGFAEGDHWLLRPFLNTLVPLVLAWEKQDNYKLISLLRLYSPLLMKSSLKSKKNPEKVLTELNKFIAELAELFTQAKRGTVRDILSFAQSKKILRLDDRIVEALENKLSLDEDILAAIEKYFNLQSAELLCYYKYIENDSPYSTQHGIKGAEFDRVLVVLDDEEGKDYNSYSYEKLLGLKDLSKTDIGHIEANEESVLDRTRKLFYVCCSRARHDLAIVLFTENTEEAHKKILQSNIVPNNNIITI